MSDEKFDKIYRPNEEAIQLVNDGRACEKTKGRSYGCTLGSPGYSVGCHLIRIRADYGVSFLGIRSQSIPPQPDEDACGRFDASPSTYGWVTNVGRICNGRSKLCKLEVKNTMKSK